MPFWERIPSLDYCRTGGAVKNLGVCASRASVTAALAELGLELELSSSRAVAPARTREDIGAQIRAHSFSFRRQTTFKRGQDSFRGAEGRAPGRHRVPPKRRGLQNRGGETLGLEASSYLDDLLSQGLIYCDPSRELIFLAADAIGFTGSGFAVLH